MSRRIESECGVAALLFRRVGDSLLATPALRAMKQHRPEAQVIVLSEPQVARIFEHNPSVDEIVTVGRPAAFVSLAAALRISRPTTVLDFLSDPRSGLSCFLSGARQRVGIAGRGRNWMYTHTVPRQNPAQPIYSAFHKLALAAAVGAESQDATTEFHLREDDRAFAEAVWSERGWDRAARVAAFFVHSRREYKRWPVDCFHEVIRRMQRESAMLPLVLVTPGDESAVAELRARSGLPVWQTVPVVDLGHLGAVLERCAVLVGNDGGPKHMAVAVGTPTLTVFMQDSPLFWTPPDHPLHVALGPQATPAEVYSSLLQLAELRTHER
ncbi:MAG: glycosyltransferase family 9 protein [bacterium]|nr:glycosyltransferase family 9 protein [bacterium]